MNRTKFFALVSLLGSFGVACSDDDDVSSPLGGSGGASGSSAGGSSAGGSSAGGTSAGGSGGSAGSGGAGGSTVTPPFTGIATCSGCVEVEVPVSGGNSAANVLDQVGFPFFYAAPGQDFSGVVVTWRVMALENNDDLMVAPYAENGAPYPGAYHVGVALSAANFPPGEWVDVVFDLSAVPLPVALPDGGVVDDAGTPTATDAGAPDPDPVGDAGLDAAAPSGPLADFRLIAPDFDKRLIQQLGLYVGSGPNLEGDAIARVAIDSVTFTGTPERADVPFTTGLEGLTKNTFEEPPGTQGPLWHP